MALYRFSSSKQYQYAYYEYALLSFSVFFHSCITMVSGRFLESLVKVMLYLPHISWRSVTGVVLIINIIVFVCANILPSPVSHYLFVSIPYIITPGTFLSMVSHFDLLHLLSNMYLLVMLGTILESLLTRKDYILLLALSGLMVAVGWFFVFDGPTLWFSGIAMAMISYTYFSRNIFIDKQELLILLVINILIWLSPGVSFAWHALGSAAGYVLSRKL